MNPNFDLNQSEHRFLAAFHRFAAGDADKYDFYGVVEELHRRRKVTYGRVAELTGIDKDVVAMRVRYLRHLAHPAFAKSWNAA